MKIELRSGRTIALSTLRQSLTYQGMLAGLPTRDSNERRMAKDVGVARKLGSEGCEPVLLSPTPEVTGRKLRGTDIGEERLPCVTCVAKFDSGPLERKGSEPYSTVVVVWYQDEFGLPDDATRGRLLELDWEAVARDWCW